MGCRVGIPVAVGLVTPAGELVRLEFVGAEGALLQVAIARVRLAELSRQLGERLYLTPRTMWVFLDA